MIEENKELCTMNIDYAEKLGRKLEMIFEKMLDIEDKLLYDRITKEEEEIKKQQQELEYRKQDLAYRKNNIYEDNRRQREAFRKGYWD